MLHVPDGQSNTTIQEQLILLKKVLKARLKLKDSKHLFFYVVLLCVFSTIGANTLRPNKSLFQQFAIVHSGYLLMIHSKE